MTHPPSQPYAPPLTAVAAVLALAAPAAAQNPAFEPLERNHFDVPPTEGTCVAGDFDGDGDVDLLYLTTGVVGTPAQTVHAYFNDGHGFFRVGPGFPLPGSGLDLGPFVRVIDLDGDGTQEVLVYSAGTGGLEMLRLNPAGTTSTSIATFGIDIPMGMLVADLDGDGDPDVAVGHASGPTTVFTNQNGTLVEDAARQFPSIAKAVIGHFDADPFLDLVAVEGGFTATIVMHRGQPGGAFAPGVALASFGLGSSRLLAGDFDGDGDLDLAYHNSLFVFSSYGLLRNDGSAGFVPIDGPPITASPRLFPAGVFDVDGDGIDDLLLDEGSPLLSINTGARELRWLRMTGGQPSSLQNALLVRSDENSLNNLSPLVAGADFDGDGDLDLAAGQGRVLLRRENAEFASARTFHPDLGGRSLPGATRAVGTTVMVPGLGALRLGADGIATLQRHAPLAASDAAWLEQPRQRMVACDGQTLQTSVPPYTDWFPSPLTDVHAVAVDPARQRAIASCSDFPCGLAVLPDLGATSLFAPSPAVPTPPRLPTAGYEGILVADLDGDGQNDIVHSFRWLRGQATGPFLDAGDLFAAAPTGVRDIAPIDFDGDGDLDLYVGRAGMDMLLELHDGVFTEVTIGRIPPESGDCLRVSAGDFDGDGDDDLLVATAAGSTTPPRLLRNDGGVFHLAPNAPADSLVLVDIDADGDADVLTRTGYLRNARRQLHAPRLPLLGADYALELHWHPANGAVGFGAIFTGMPASAIAVPGIDGTLAVDAATAEVWAALPLAPGAVGATRHIPATATLFGLQFASQGLFFETTGARFSNVLQEQVQ